MPPNIGGHHMFLSAAYPNGHPPPGLHPPSQPASGAGSSPLPNYPRTYSYQMPPPAAPYPSSQQQYFYAAHYMVRMHTRALIHGPVRATVRVWTPDRTLTTVCIREHEGE
eukprot:GHVU01146695.1.p2 GENE.GHVU01146695.1~~GHVU01146695.1.p2  ORF type:complete len:110 (-),score=6.30 GHVU01146695.1:122-451(-)